MAESSITHNFIVRDPEAIARLVKALEESANDPPMPFTVDAKFLDDPDELREFMERRRANLQRKLQANACSKGCS